MTNSRAPHSVGAAILFVFTIWTGQGDAAAAAEETLAQVLQRGLSERTIVGAQSAVGSRQGAVQLAEYGVLAPGSRQHVDRDTLFGIGSCSKPFASACLLSLVDSGALDLDKPIDHWLPGFGGLKLSDGTLSMRAPTLRELLAHRGGIYSQKRGPMTPAQTRAIRDFRLSLEESVRIISKQPLLAEPGTTFAYSGAGYCVLGRVAEAATSQSFEQIFQRQLAVPLELTRTTFFPRSNETNIAAGGTRQRGRIVTHPQTPYLLKEQLALPLIGGSLHSTAEETARFARMILNRGSANEQTILSQQAWDNLTRPQFDGQAYGLGWTLDRSNEKTTSMRHGGALHGNRSLIYLNVASGTFTIVHWTLTDPEDTQGKTFGQELLQAASP